MGNSAQHRSVRPQTVERVKLSALVPPIGPFGTSCSRAVAGHICASVSLQKWHRSQFRGKRPDCRLARRQEHSNFRSRPIRRLGFRGFSTVTSSAKLRAETRSAAAFGTGTALRGANRLRHRRDSRRRPCGLSSRSFRLTQGCSDLKILFAHATQNDAPYTLCYGLTYVQG